MKNTLKGKMVKTHRPKVNLKKVNCECIDCSWQGDVESVKTDKQGNFICPNCKKSIVIY